MSRLSLWKIVALAALLTSAACGGDEKSNNGESNNDSDMALEDMADMANPDMADMEADQGSLDNDEDGVLNADDNCPDAANPDQLDRDRDGVGDICDQLPYIYAPSDPASVFSISEADEDNSAPGLGEAYGIESATFRAEGSVSAVLDGEADVDFYSFEIDKPTALLVRIEGSGEIWPAFFVAGYEYRNNNTTRIGFGPDAGQPGIRELFLPVPGKYTLVVSDFRNFIESAPDVGSDTFTYSITLGALPLPAAEEVSIPSPTIPKTYDETLHVFRVDTRGIDALEVKATGIPLSQNAFHQPSVAIVEEDVSRTLGHVIGGQVSVNNTSLVRAQLAGRESVLVVEDFFQRFETNSTALEFAEIDLSTELETPQEPADERSSDLPWLVAGSNIAGTIGPPRPSGPTTLEADIDYYMVNTKRGEGLRIVVTPTSGSQLIPSLEAGPLLDDQGSSFLVDYHRSEDPNADGSGSLEYFFTADQDGEFAIGVQHGDNMFSSSPVGGPQYGYTLSVEAWEPPVTALGAVPASGATTINAGSLGYVSFTATQGAILNGSVDGNMFFDTRIINPTTLETVVRGTESIVAQIVEDGEYWLEIKDYFGRGTAPNEPVTISLNQSIVEDFGTLPGTHSGVVDSIGKTSYYRVSVPAGELLDIRANVTGFLSYLKIYDTDFQLIRSTLSTRTQFRPEEAQDFIVSISAYQAEADPSYTWTLGARLVSPTPLPALPASLQGTLSNEPFGEWYSVDVTDGTAYGVRFTSTGDNFTPRIYGYESADLGYVKNGNGEFRFVADFTGELLISAYDDENRGDPSFAFELSMRELAIIPLTLNTPVAGTLADSGDEALYSFSALPGFLEARADVTGDWFADIKLLDGDSLNTLGEALTVGELVRYARSEPDDYVISISAASTGNAGPYAFDVLAALTPESAAIAEIEPNDSEAQATVLSGDIELFSAALALAEAGDYYSVNLIAGQRVWALMSDRNDQGIYSFNGRIALIDPDGQEVVSNSTSGEGFFPAIRGQIVAKSGLHHLKVSTNSMTFTGDYFVSFVTSDVASFVDTEPNDSIAEAQILGSNEMATISASLSATDTADYYQFTLNRSNTSVNIGLQNAADGHDLQLWDAGGTLIESAGMSFNGAAQPAISTTLSAGIYHVSFERGTTDGSADVVITTR